MAEESDDWFERALAEDGTDDESTESDAESPSKSATEGDPPEPTENGESGSDLSVDSSGDATFGDDADWEAVGDGPEGNAADPVADRDDGSADDGDSLFEEDFASALEDADVPAPADEGGAAGPSGFEDVDLGLQGAGETDFEADVESYLPRLDLGIDGLDRMIQGGVPERSLMVAIGSAGTGKTTFGMQFLNHGLAQGEQAVFIGLEESRRRIINSATEKGFPFDEYVEDDRLAIVDIDPVEMANSLTSIRSELPTLVEEFGASRLVLDSVSLLEMMYDEQATRRNEVYDFTKSLKQAGVTALLTSEAADRNPYASRHGIVEYLTDAVFVLQYVRPDDFRETRLAIEIQKIRDANHSREKKPYEITDEGISVYQQANLF
ncbi:KaiC domain-containing protein [Halopiger goleimassiliensis]|uniref:KaiC domain-containing protein n=1 Tax=Halopiger goleimassiliensis TaxID=1293048 RepID=UPI0009DBDA93|nr:KaiC domain-containing protein [Halopiger goleimassiliensis]